MKSFFIYSVQLMRVDRPIGTVLLATPMLWALWLSSQGPAPANIVLIFMLGAFLMRSAGCVINDFADRNIDSQVKRTKERVLTSGKISAQSAIILFFILIGAALVLLMLLPHSAILPAIFAFALATIYPFAKRFFIIPQLVLGAAYGMSILMAYRTISDEIPSVAWVLFFASVIWTVIYDTFYAMVDRDDDKILGIHSSALWFGRSDLFVLKISAVVFLVLMSTVGLYYHLGAYYYLGLCFAASCFLYQFVITRSRERAACFAAFLNNQWVGVFIFLGIWLSYLP